MRLETPFLAYWRTTCPKLHLGEAWACYKLQGAS